MEECFGDAFVLGQGLQAGNVSGSGVLGRAVLVGRGMRYLLELVASWRGGLLLSRCYFLDFGFWI